MHDAYDPVTHDAYDSVFFHWSSFPSIVENACYRCAEKVLMSSKDRLFHHVHTLSAVIASNEPRDHERLHCHALLDAGYPQTSLHQGDFDQMDMIH